MRWKVDASGTGEDALEPMFEGDSHACFESVSKVVCGAVHERSHICLKKYF